MHFRSPVSECEITGSVGSVQYKRDQCADMYSAITLTRENTHYIDGHYDCISQKQRRNIPSSLATTFLNFVEYLSFGESRVLDEKQTIYPGFCGKSRKTKQQLIHKPVDFS